MTSNTHSVQRNCAAVLTVLAEAVPALLPKSQHGRDLRTYHTAIFPVVRLLQEVSAQSTHQRLLWRKRPSCAIHSHKDSACTFNPLKKEESTIADTDAKQPLLTLPTADPLEAENRAVAAALNQPGCGGFMRFVCRKEEAKA